MPGQKINRLDAVIKEKGYKLTGPRRRILEYLAAADGHPCVQEIYTAVRKVLPGTGLATVYRTLDLLTRLGLARALLLNDNRPRYEINRPGHNHHHLICTGCGKVVEFRRCAFPQIVETIEKETRFRIEKHDLEAYGTCAQCSRPPS